MAGLIADVAHEDEQDHGPRLDRAPVEDVLEEKGEHERNGADGHPEQRAAADEGPEGLDPQGVQVDQGRRGAQEVADGGDG